MSDFKVIKCKKCDAGLVELSGQKLSRCVQCGYAFGSSSKESSHRRPQTINGTAPQTIQQTQDTIEASVSSGQVKSKPEMQALIRKLKAIKNSARTTASQTRTKRKASDPIPKKKKGFPIASIIFWIILFNVLRNIFKM